MKQCAADRNLKFKKKARSTDQGSKQKNGRSERPFFLQLSCAIKTYNQHLSFS